MHQFIYSIFKNISSAHYYRVIKDDYNYYWYNKHKLVTNDESFIWGKTGYTKLSKRILISNYVENNMDLIVVTINDSNDWNSHKKLVNDLDEYVFYKIFEKGIHEIVLDKKYYLIASNTISMPILETELPYIQIEFIIYNTKALLMVRTSNILIYQTDINLYDKNNINIDDALEKLF